ncbi:MAG: DUF6048 family protein [Candidatus Amulumruptor caecigallinarius]|nr:DUF6048 family protein [Candidatus Amulumruptor caecigallinarius]
MNNIVTFFALAAAILLPCLRMHADELSVADSVPAVPVAVDSLKTPRRAVPTTTPVDIDDDRPRAVLHYYDKHGDPLPEPVLFVAELDTVTTPKAGPVFPLINGYNIGVNFADAILMAFGSGYGSFDVWANMSLHNWIFPTVELGVGFANDTPDKKNFTYKMKPSFYAKIGANYNFLYKSNPDYQVYLGLRAGYSSFTYDITDVTISDGYWGETQQISMEGLKGSCIFGEVLAGLQVKIVKNFSLGWSVRWHFKMHTSSDTPSKPWFVPGYGGSSPFGFSLSAILSL